MIREDQPSAPPSSTSPTPAILRAGTILRTIADSGGAPVRANALAATVGIPRSSLVNICAALAEIGMLSQSSQGYTLGPTLGELGHAFFQSFVPVRNFTDYCQAVGPRLDVTVQLGTLERFEVVYLGRHDSNQAVSIASRIGGRLPANCTALGKAMLSSLSPHERTGIVAAQSEPLPSFTERSRTTRASLEADIAFVESMGYAIDDEETTPGIICVAVPISRLQTADRAFAVSASLLTRDATDARIGEVVDQLRTLAVATAGMNVPEVSGSLR